MIDFFIDHYTKYIHNIYDMQRDIFLSMDLQNRKCDRCDKYKSCGPTLFTERVWVCRECEADDISKRVKKQMIEMLGVRASSLKQFLEISIL